MCALTDTEVPGKQQQQNVRGLSAWEGCSLPEGRCNVYQAKMQLYTQPHNRMSGAESTIVVIQLEHSKTGRDNKKKNSS